MAQSTTADAPAAMPLDNLKTQLADIANLEQAASLLSWDQETQMPPGAAPARGEQLTTLAKIIHEKVTSKVLGDTLQQSQQALTEGVRDEDKVLLELTDRMVSRSRKLPSEFVETWTRAVNASHHAWIEARSNNDFQQFAPHLQTMVELSRKRADYLGYDDHPYDALHDLYERDSSTATIKRVFADLRDATKDVLAKIANSGTMLSDAPLRQDFDETAQEEFAAGVIKRFGYSFEHGRIDRSVHPFATSFSNCDVRITTRYEDGFLSPALFGTMHESGHAMYEQGIAAKFQRSPLGNAASLGIHESQSRLWENLVGRSLPFWEGAYPLLQETFPKQLEAVSLADFYAAINVVSPSFIRVEADEVTYNLHIMVRFELELDLIEGHLHAADLPEAWNTKYQDYLGISPSTDALGCLQDIHWSGGSFGYFPTYSMGNLMSVQLFNAALAAEPSIHEDMRALKFDKLLTWMRNHVHQHGSLYTPQV
ncbi:MAG: carboxypeptidase M32, partial [Deinococcota bacterium]